MIKTSRFIYLSVLVPALFVLSACGDSDKGTASAPAPAPAETAAAPAPATEEADTGFDISSIEKADGVVYQDEIYANWPYN
ncbi:MAG: hypothetical protein RIB78_04080 [Gammaproteobacteria bacterium]